MKIKDKTGVSAALYWFLIKYMYFPAMQLLKKNPHWGWWVWLVRLANSNRASSKHGQ